MYEYWKGVGRDLKGNAGTWRAFWGHLTFSPALGIPRNRIWPSRRSVRGQMRSNMKTGWGSHLFVPNVYITMASSYHTSPGHSSSILKGFSASRGYVEGWGQGRMFISPCSFVFCGLGDTGGVVGRVKWWKCVMFWPLVLPCASSWYRPAPLSNYYLLYFFPHFPMALCFFFSYIPLLIYILFRFTASSSASSSSAFFNLLSSVPMLLFLL